ncbi:protein ZNF365 [Aythya fuligula]|uniref:Protein ZNF365 n=1 Tax=Aythya fuligula TaxID=219594 RepID=A0A6J3D9R5_AYTFU|nr:protein ZNF365 [Aythya fuligula]
MQQGGGERAACPCPCPCPYPWPEPLPLPLGSLAALRAHLQHGHGGVERRGPAGGRPLLPLRDAAPGSPPEPCGRGSASRRREGKPEPEPEPEPEAPVRAKLSRVVEAVDEAVEKRLARLSGELAQKTAELLEVRAAFVQLSQKKQEVQRRERALSRQVDVAVEMIAALKQRLSESEEELQRKEEEVVTFNHFLEEAAEKELRGKARLQHFIENLLQRVDLAERQLEYYQNQQVACSHMDVSDHVFTDISLNKKPRCLSRGSQHASYNIPDTKPHSFQKGRVLLKKAKEEKNSLQQVRCFYEPVDCPREIWRAQKKGEPGCSARKVSAKSKMGKKSKQL